MWEPAFDAGFQAPGKILLSRVDWTFLQIVVQSRFFLVRTMSTLNVAIPLCTLRRPASSLDDSCGAGVLLLRRGILGQPINFR